MVVLHAFLALLAGFAVMAALVVLVTAALARFTPDWVDPARSNSPSTAYVFVKLGYSFVAAAAGGYVTAWVAANNSLYHVLALAIVVLALSALSALQQRGKQPVWYALALVGLTPLGILAGGLVRLRVLGIL
jgi:hypothetical protein